MANWIQEHVLGALIRHKTRRYSELRPQDIEGNLFMYHLKGLLREGYVEKDEKHYRLSQKGMQYVSQLSLATGKQRTQPQILNCIVARNEKNEYLFVRWHRQPNLGLISFPHGMMHFGESSEESVRRELAEKAALTGDISYINTVLIRSLRAGEVERHMMIRIFKAENVTPLAASIRTEVSEPFWASLRSLPPDEFIPGFYELAQEIESKSELPVEIVHKKGMKKRPVGRKWIERVLLGGEL